MKAQDHFNQTQLDLGDKRICADCVRNAAQVRDEAAREAARGAAGECTRERSACRQMKTQDRCSQTQLDLGDKRVCADCVHKAAQVRDQAARGAAREAARECTRECSACRQTKKTEP